MRGSFSYSEYKDFLSTANLQNSVNINLESDTFTFTDLFLEEVDHFMTSYGDERQVNSWEQDIKGRFEESLNERIMEEFGLNFSNKPPHFILQFIELSHELNPLHLIVSTTYKGKLYTIKSGIYSNRESKKLSASKVTSTPVQCLISESSPIFNSSFARNFELLRNASRIYNFISNSDFIKTNQVLFDAASSICENLRIK